MAIYWLQHWCSNHPSDGPPRSIRHTEGTRRLLKHRGAALRPDDDSTLKTEDDYAKADEADAQPFAAGGTLTKKYDSDDCDEDDAEFVDWCDFGRIAELQSSEVANP
jgi:hypothetical protein